MSNTQDPRPESDKPLPEPVGEDGIVHPEDKTDRDREVEDAGLAETGAGGPDERKIV